MLLRRLQAWSRAPPCLASGRCQPGRSSRAAGLQIAELGCKVDRTPAFFAVPQDTWSLAIPDVHSHLPHCSQVMCCPGVLKLLSVGEIDPGLTCFSTAAFVSRLMLLLGVVPAIAIGPIVLVFGRPV